MEVISRKDAKSKGLTRYFTGKPCKHGHIAERRTVNGSCSICAIKTDKESRERNKEERKKRRKEYKKNNREKVNASRMKWYNKNRDRELKKRRDYDKANSERIYQKTREYLESNKDDIREKRRGYYREYMAKRRKDPEFLVKTRMRDMLRRIRVKSGRDKLSKTEVECGYSSSELKRHIESLWLDGMNWDNYGDWHIDHIKPIKKFIDSGVTDPKVINALSNLQPLWAFDNLSKGAK